MQALAFLPGLTTVLAAEHIRRACAHPDCPRQRMLGDGPDVLVDDALVSLLPRLPPVLADEEAGSGCARVQTAWIILVLNYGGAHHALALEADEPCVELAILLFDEVEAVGGTCVEDAIRSAH